MKRILFYAINLSIPLLWFFSIYLLAGQSDQIQGRLKVEEVFGETPETVDAQYWAGVYLKDEKIGYSYQSYQNSKKGILYKEYLKMRLPLGGAVREVEADNFALLDSALAIKSFSAGMTSGDYEITIHGLVDNNVLQLDYITGGKHNSKTMPLEDKIYFQGQAPRVVKSAGFKEGVFTMAVFDPLSLNISELKVDVGQANISDEDTTYTIKVDMNGIKTTMTVNSDGEVLRDEQPGGMMLVKEERNKALALKSVYAEGEDFLKKLSVSSSVNIKNDRKTTYLKAELQDINVSAYILDDGCTQRLLKREPVIVEIDRNNPKAVEIGDPDEFLKSSEFIQSDDPMIMELSESIIKDISDRKDWAYAISDWVHDNIEKDISVSVPSAVEVLRVKRGDCNEHTVLYVALARAAGIPCKTVIGIVHKDGMFFYHAWPAVYLGYWHHLDPTFGQHTADATHIQLLEGSIEKQAELVNVVGKLKVIVLGHK